MMLSARCSFFTLMILIVISRGAAAAALPDFRSIVKSSSPAVVKIIVEQTRSPENSSPDDLEEIPEYLRRFF